ncbi:MAG TPA: hypothetical protein P5338_11110 [Bacteroidales bacterium]|nr:hypothetical protein [Bacteroidales bacterium]
MKNLILIVLAALTATLSSCSKDEAFDLSETIFIEDSYYPGLPIYSEWGYNTFGAYIDRAPFVSNTSDLPVKIYVNGDTMHFILKGRVDGTEAVLTFHLQGYSPATNFDLVSLDKTFINLKDPGRSATLKIGNVTTELTIIEGELEFKRVQRLILDNEPTRVIMSGYFQLKTFLNGEPAAISNGRFDLGIGYGNFFNF